MSRLLKYKESLLKFIKDRSKLLELNSMPNPELEPIIYNLIKNDDMFLPIICLTIMNNQNKKNHITVQGYYAASIVEVLTILKNLIETEKSFKIKYGDKMYNDMINYLILASNKTFHSNAETIKLFIKQENMYQILMATMNVFQSTMSYDTLLAPVVLETTNNKPAKDLLKWYLKDDPVLIEKHNSLKQVSQESFNNYINKKIGAVSEYAFVTGWLIGCGAEADIPKIKKISRYFAMIYKLSRDFANIENDLKNLTSNFSTNFVINYGLQESYEMFIYNQQKFIEETMVNDIFTSTVKEIVEHIEKIVDDIIDTTSPDLKSSCSTISSKI